MIGHNGGPKLGAGRWIAIDVDIEHHPIVGFGKKPVDANDKSRPAYSIAEAWESLLFLASAKPMHIESEGRTMTLERGDLLGAYSFLATRWNWHASKVRRFIEKLIKHEMVVKNQNATWLVANATGSKTDNRGGMTANVITIRNYSHYQHDGWRSDNDTDNGSTMDRQSTDNEPTISKQGKQGNNNSTRSETDVPTEPEKKKQKRHAYTDVFQTFWKKYYRLASEMNASPGDKLQAFNEWQRLDNGEKTLAYFALDYLKAFHQRELQHFGGGRSTLRPAVRYLHYRGWEKLEPNIFWLNKPTPSELKQIYDTCPPNGQWPENWGPPPGHTLSAWNEVAKELGLDRFDSRERK